MPVDEAEPFDRDALAAKYLDRVQRFARKLAGRSPQWFEDAEGEAVVGLAKALNNFDPAKGSDFEALLMKTVRRRVVRRLAALRRQGMARPAVVPLLDDDLSARPIPARRELQADTVAKLRHDPQALEAVRLVFCAGMSHREAGLLLGVSKAQVAVLLRRAAELIGPDDRWDKV